DNDRVRAYIVPRAACMPLPSAKREPRGRLRASPWWPSSERVSLMTRILPLPIGVVLVAVLASSEPALPASETEFPANTWIRLQSDNQGARRGCALRFAPAASTFFRWGFMEADPEFRQEEPAMIVPEYDMVAFDLDGRRWRNHLPPRWEAEWTRKLPPA